MEKGVKGGYSCMWIEGKIGQTVIVCAVKGDY